MRKTFAAIDQHVDCSTAYLGLRPEATGSLPGVREISASIESAADLDAAVESVDPDVVVQNHRFEAEVLGERPAFHDEYTVVHVRHGASVGRGEIANTTRDLGSVVDVALAPGEHWATQYRRSFPDDVRVSVVGLPEADALVGTDPPRKRRVLYAPTNHNYGGGCYVRTAEQVLDVFEGSDFELRFRPHPMDRIEEPGRTVTKRCRERIASLPNVVFDDDTTPRESLLWADVLLSDYSGLVTEWLQTGRPLVQLIDLASDAEVPQLGLTTDSLDLETVTEVYESGYPPAIAESAADAIASLGIPMDGRAGERAAREVVECTQ
ncbi:CDP-glycerol glycerophosphotransferase family protein [Haloarculaceae archaeon H-GB2-1]|nr:CDP-glycerol glycerophosphotransferase family protein [Haloarculaceae archaeon H-GB2-1]